MNRFLIRPSIALLAAVLLGLTENAADGQATSRLSISSAGLAGDDDSRAPVISADGRFVAFASLATNLVEDDTNDAADVFVDDRLTGLTERVSLTSNGVQGDDSSGLCRSVGTVTCGIAISDDGRFVAFASDATNFVPNDSNGAIDVFLRDREAATTIRLSSDANGASGDGRSWFPTISADGRYVAYWSYANNLVPNDTNPESDVFLYNRISGQTALVSVDSSGVQGNRFSLYPSLSSDGRYIAFRSQASNLVPSDTNSTQDVFVHDRDSGETVRASVSWNESEPDSDSFYPSISTNGEFVAFASFADNLVPGDSNHCPNFTPSCPDVFVRDRLGHATTRVSVSSSGEQADGPNLEPVISRDGRFVAFSSLADNLVSDDANGVRDVFLHDRMAAGTIRASVNSAGIEADGDSSAPSISAGGRFVVFESIATNLIANDANGKADIFVRDLAPCGDGTVHDLSGTAVAVLGVNGNTGVVTLGRGQSVDFTLDVTPTGPNPARYIVWIWPVLPTNQMDLRAMGQSLGCTVNPTPLARGARPQPVACLRGTGVPAPACGTAHSMHAPASAPWVVRRTQGFANPVVFTLQGVIEDAGSASSTGFSVTNAVEVVIE